MVVEPPHGIVELVTVVPTEGAANTVIKRVAEFVQPFAFVPITVYVVVVTGLTLTEVPLNPPGFQT